MSYFDQAGYNGYNTSGYGGFAAVGKRPGTVTAASYLLYACAALALAGAVSAFAASGPVSANMRAAGSVADDVTTGEAVMIVYGVAAIIVAALMAMCAIFVTRRRQGLRVTTFIVAGLAILCTGCGAVNSGGDALIANGSVSNTGSAADQAIIAAMPGWYEATSATLESIVVVLLIIVIILIAIPKSGAYYRSQVFQMPGYGLPAGYPAAPGYGAAPGYVMPAGYPTVHPGYPAYPQSAAPWLAPNPAGYPATGYPTTGYPTDTPAPDPTASTGPAATPDATLIDRPSDTPATPPSDWQAPPSQPPADEPPV
jgi:hypothetical protein